MPPKALKPIIDKVMLLPKYYTQHFRPKADHFINILFVQPFKSLLRYNLYKRTYNPNYSRYITFIKSFFIFYCYLNFSDLNIATKSLIGNQFETTQYLTMVKNVSEDYAGASKTQYAMKEMLEKGKKHGLLSIELNQIAYLLEPYEIAWQGRYIASLKA